MAEYNLTVQMAKYDPAEIEDDLKNLDGEIADEDTVNTTLINDDVEKRLADTRKFLADNKDRIVEQHARMQAGVKKLKEMVNTNIALESASAEYKALVEGEEAQLVAKLLTELNVMSLQYRELLLDAGRAGRPLLF